MMNSYDEIINDCFNDFAAPETEHNWSKRRVLCDRLSAQLEKTKCNVPKDFFERIKPLLTSFLGAATSERTSLSNSACLLFGNICKAVGSSIHSQLDFVLPKFIALCGNTKKITQNHGNNVVLTICQTAGYNPRLLHHVCSAFHEKSKNIRQFAPNWLTILLQTYQYSLDPDKDYPLIEKAINAGLNDSEKATREAARITYWVYAKLEKNTAYKIMEGLNSHAAAALKADPNNPNKSDEPAKPARPESALSQIRAAKIKQTQPQKIPNAKRNITPMSIASITSDDFHFGPLDRIDGPNPALVPMSASPTLHEGAVEATEYTHTQRYIRQGKIKPPAQEPVQPEATSIKSLMAAPVRRPRVVATPMSAQSHAVTRPASKDEASKKSIEPIQRSVVEKRGGRQTPTILEDSDVRAQSSTSKKSSLHSAHKSESFKTSSARPSSSASEPAGLKSPKRPTAQPKSLDALPLRHQKSSSASEPRAHNVIPAPAIKTMSPPHTIDGKENADAQRSLKQVTTQAGDTLEKAVRSITAIAEALRQHKLDALGYRKLRKLVETYPGKLFVNEEQFNDFYTVLISSMASIDEYAEPREERRKNLDHPFYNRMTIVHIAILLLAQYSRWGEPQPGMTLVALLKARGHHVKVDEWGHAVDAIEIAAWKLLDLPAISMVPHPVIDSIIDALIEIEQIILESDPVSTPSTYSRSPLAAIDKKEYPPSQASVKAALGITEGAPLRSLAEGDCSLQVGPFSYTSEFGTSVPKLPDRLPRVMAFGLQILTRLIEHSASFGRRLYNVQEQRLVDLAKNLLKSYRLLLKRDIMAFSSALHTIIQPEERFFAFFENESDRNLLFYCVKSDRLAAEALSEGLYV